MNDKNQRHVWDSIAEPWHRFRKKSRKDGADFIKERRGAVLDLACGSGRNFANINGTLVGADFSENMLIYAKEKIKREGLNTILIKADASELPFKDKAFDGILFSHSLHCIEKRDECLSEMKRILKSNGEIFISVWSKNQPRFFFANKEAYIPWKHDGKIYQRYYYLFTKNELKETLEKNGLEVLSIRGSKDKAFKLFPRNIIAIVRKAGVPKKPFFFARKSACGKRTY